MTSTRVLPWEEEYNRAKAARILIEQEMLEAQKDKKKHRLECLYLINWLLWKEIYRLEMGTKPLTHAKDDEMTRLKLAESQQNK